MKTAEIKYLGGLRTEVRHLKSNTAFNTDAPLDNMGRGSFISPSDMIAASLGSCMQTIVGIYCQEREINFENATILVNKVMGDKPRRIIRLELNLNFSGNDWDERTQRGVRAAAEACPVAKSIHPDIELVYSYQF